MINTTGIQSTGPQGLPGSTSQPAIANEQDEAKFYAMMATSNPSSSVEELKAKLDTAKDKLNAVMQTGNQAQIDMASIAYQAARAVYDIALLQQNGTLPK